MTPTRFLVGGYSADLGGTATGIGLASTDDDGRLRFRGVVAEAASPSWLLVDGSRLFAALEGDGRVGAWQLAFDGGRLQSTGSADAAGLPCHLELDGERLLASDYGGGVLGVLGPDASGGLTDAVVGLAGEGSGPHPAQDAAHIHSALRLADARVLVADLGTDTVSALEWSGSRYERAATLRLTSGSGPRDLLAIAPDRVLLLSELRNEVVLLDVAGEPQVVASLPVPGARPGDHAAGLAGDPARGIVHVGLRGSNRIGSIRVDGDALEAVGQVPCGGDWPRHLVVDGALLHVANQLSGTVASFRLDAGGLPHPIGPATAVPSPTHLLPLPARGWEHLEPLLG